MFDYPTKFSLHVDYFSGSRSVEAPPEQIEYAWGEGKTAGISSFRTQFNLSELASGEDTAGNPKDIPDLHLIKNMKFTIVTECIDGYRNVIGAYRDFRVLQGERGKLLIEVTRTVSAQKVGHRIRSYPQLQLGENLQSLLTLARLTIRDIGRKVRIFAYAGSRSDSGL